MDELRRIIENRSLDLKNEDEKFCGRAKGVTGINIGNVKNKDGVVSR